MADERKSKAVRRYALLSAAVIITVIVGVVTAFAIQDRRDRALTAEIERNLNFSVLEVKSPLSRTPSHYERLHR
jgi:hypothetical protein